MSNNERQLVENIRKGYEEKKTTKLEELKALDKKTKRPAKVFAYTFGTMGALILGSGMCLAMPEVIEGYMPLGIGVGIIGIIMVSVNYWVYSALLKSRRRKASAEIFRLSGEILGNV
ncbi:MAG: dihydropteridine reductase [Clostridia bacterium]|nr:dihydropteridine reductase [Clostridia bacterium]